MYFNARNFTLNLNRTYVMGILNVTPDSFSDGNKYFDEKKAIEHAVEMFLQGADVIDIGGQSTRPGHTRVSEDEEWDRLKKIIPEIRSRVDIPISVDTFYSSVAQSAIKLGADIINDVSGFSDEKMFNIAKETSCGCVIMCNTGLDDLESFFLDKIEKINKCGLNKENICFDPGIGFGKTYEENLKILKETKKYCPQGYPILVGASKKRVIGTSCGNPCFDERIPGTIAAHTLSIASGANIVRVHNVAEAVQAARTADAILDK